MNTDQKTCFKCNTTKPLSEFYKHKQMGDGHLNKCKTCTKSDAYQRRHNSPARDRILEYDRKRGSRQTQGQINAYRSRRPLVTKAHSAVGRALNSGQLVRPEACEHCSKVGRVNGHHEDYHKPLDVIWLCVACHRELHAYYETIGRVIPGSEPESNEAA